MADPFSKGKGNETRNDDQVPANPPSNPLRRWSLLEPRDENLGMGLRFKPVLNFSQFRGVRVVGNKSLWMM